MTNYLWPGDPGWPAPEVDAPALTDIPDPSGELDLDAICLHVAQRHVLSHLSPLERTVLTSRFALDGAPVRTMKQLHTELGLTRHEVRDALETALAKVRNHLAA